MEITVEPSTSGRNKVLEVGLAVASLVAVAGIVVAHEVHQDVEPSSPNETPSNSPTHSSIISE